MPKRSSVDKKMMNNVLRKQNNDIA